MDLKMGLHTNFDYLPTLLGIHISISPTKVLLRMIFLFSGWDMLVPRRVNQLDFNFMSGLKNITPEK